MLFKDVSVDRGICDIFSHSLDRSKLEVLRDVRSSKSGNNISFSEIGLNMRTHTSPKLGQDQVSGGVNVLC